MADRRSAIQVMKRPAVAARAASCISTTENRGGKSATAASMASRAAIWIASSLTITRALDCCSA